MQKNLSNSKKVDYFDPSREPLTPYGLSCVQWQPSVMTQYDRHNEVELNYLADGEVTYQFHHRQVTLLEGSLAIFWATTPHRITAHSDTTEYYVATIPLPLFLAWDLPVTLSNALLGGQVIQDTAGSSAIDLARFKSWMVDLSHNREDISRAVLLEMQARLLRVEPQAYANSNALSAGQNPDKIEKLLTFLNQNYTEPLTASAIGGAVNLHANYAMSLFKQSLGITITQYLTHLRVAHAQHLLLATNERILDIAAHSGFSSLSRFNSVFKQELGVSPRAYRSSRGLEIKQD
ncbi:helix-turn-helix domain-containing protein [Halioxenophilus aromaticivorans]|uniref:Helix-turn-helix domain-containing protein n=2 Tax=Halioxenophilus aromaticivorans TaxID=1306992 RepID=A0AAV3U9X0_9ALTE